MSIKEAIVGKSYQMSTGVARVDYVGKYIVVVTVDDNREISLSHNAFHEAAFEIPETRDEWFNIYWSNTKGPCFGSGTGWEHEDRARNAVDHFGTTRYLSTIKLAVPVDK